jgi:undecaprenyl-phosphate 4-deoxy-4-formamido-L-arabinose transferase
MSVPSVPRKVSVVVPVYNEEANLPALLPRLLPVLRGLGRPFEVVFADDGSRDRSLELLKKAAAENPGVVKVVELVRNAGQHMAILAGFTVTDGEYVVTLDADLQNPPEEIPKLVDAMDEGHDVVGTIRQGRRDTIFRRVASRLVNRTTALITGMRLNDYGCMLRGYHRDVVDVMSASDEAATFIPALAQQYARRPVEIPVSHAERTAGESKYSLYRLVRLNFDLMTGFSVVPLQLFTLFGFVTALSGFAFGVFLLVRRLVGGAEAEGVFTLFALAFVVMGALMAGIGIVGEYVGRIYQQVRGRPRFLIRKVWEA